MTSLEPLGASSSMIQVVESEGQCAIVAGPLRLVFEWDRDRWSHRVLISEVLLAESLEMNPERDDPTRVVSPPYQQLSHQRSNDGVQALLVGQWGHHHCSGVFTVEEVESEFSIKVDVAVRTRAELNGLAATYVVFRTSSDLIDADTSGVVWGLDSPERTRLRFGVDPPGLVGLAEAGRQATTVQASSRLVLGPSTQRLFYHWQWPVAETLSNAVRETR